MTTLGQDFSSSVWRWHPEEQAAPSFLNHPEQGEWIAVKNSPVRSVYRIKTAGGREYYLKHDHPVGWWKNLVSRFRCKCAAEFHSARLAGQNGIEVVNYLGWGQCGSESLLISEAAQGWVGGKEYWFRVAIGDEKKRVIFLRQLTVFVRRFVTAGLYHPDFHCGNILVSLESGTIMLVDPYGVRASRLTAAELLQMHKIFIDFRGELAETEAVALLTASGLAEADNALDCWRQAVAAEEKEISGSWPRRVKQIMAGNSKFATTFIKDGLTCHLRHTDWYQLPCPTESLVPDPAWSRRELPHDEARQCWLDSFSDQLLRRRQAVYPCFWEEGDDGRDVLYYHSNDTGVIS